MIFLVFLAMAAVLLVFAVLLFRSGFSTTSIIWRILLCGFALTAALGFAYLAYVVFWPASAWQSELVANLPGGKGSLIAVALAGISAVIALFMLLVAYNIWAGRYIGFGRARRLGHAFTALAASIATVLFAWYYVPGGAYSIAWLSHPFGSASSTDNTSGVIEVADSTSIRSEPAGKSSVFNSNEVVRLETQLNSEQERVGSLEVQIEELEKKLTSSQTNLKDVNAALARVETERDEGRTKIVQLQNEITGIKQRMNELKQHSEADVAARLKEKDAALESLRVQLKQRQEKNTVIASLRDQHKQTAMERDDLKQLLATRQSEIDEAKTTIASLRAEKNTQSNITNAESSKIADESSRRIAALETQVKELRRIRDNLNHQVERKEASLVAGEQRISELESEARALRTRHGELDTYRDDVDARMRALRVQLTEETQATA
nr:hypothetical protein [Alphaproteobacteria bacterium]